LKEFQPAISRVENQHSIPDVAAGFEVLNEKHEMKVGEIYRGRREI